jgi:signal peptidase I
MLVCIALHTFFLAGLIVPVIVSGGSMAETILGPRREVICPNCGITFACGHERMPAGDRAICLNCGFRAVDLNQGWDWPGERALIDRASLAFRSPRRWEVFVFRCPELADTYCIKRVVGLPGETVQIRDGDIYINGKIVRKGLAECREVAHRVHDASFVPKKNDGHVPIPGWQVADASSHWHSPVAGEFAYSAAKASLVPSASSVPKVDWLEFHAARNRPPTDDDSYNQSESRRLNKINDVMLACELHCIGSGELVIRSEIERDRFDLRINPGQRFAVLLRNGEELNRCELAAAAFTQPTSLEFFRFDQQILLAIGGQLVLRQKYAPRASNEKPAKEIEEASPALASAPPPWGIGASSLQVEISHLRLLRDIYYTAFTPSRHAWGVQQPVTLSDDEFFVLGDNSPISADSRLQDQPGVERKLLVGRLLCTW